MAIELCIINIKLFDIITFLKRFRIIFKINFNYFSILSLFILLSTTFIISGYSKSFYRNIDEKNIRNQFHIPSKVNLLSLKSYPELPGWFGREGLRVEAVFQFNNFEFQDYLVTIENEEEWNPIPLIDCSPKLADSYSKLSLQWLDWPPISKKDYLNKYPPKKMYKEL